MPTDRRSTVVTTFHLLVVGCVAYVVLENEFVTAKELGFLGGFLVVEHFQVVIINRITDDLVTVASFAVQGPSRRSVVGCFATET